MSTANNSIRSFNIKLVISVQHKQGGEFLIRKQAVFIGDCSTQLFIYYTQGFYAQGYNFSVEEALFSKESVYNTETT